MIDDAARLAAAAVAVEDAMGLVGAVRRGISADGVCHMARSSRERKVVRDQLSDCLELLGAASRDLTALMNGAI